MARYSVVMVRDEKGFRFVLCESICIPRIELKNKGWRNRGCVFVWHGENSASRGGWGESKIHSCEVVYLWKIKSQCLWEGAELEMVVRMSGSGMELKACRLEWGACILSDPIQLYRRSVGRWHGLAISFKGIGFMLRVNVRFISSGFAMVIRSEEKIQESYVPGEKQQRLFCLIGLKWCSVRNQR